MCELVWKWDSTLYKEKGDIQECNNDYRGMKLMSHLMELFKSDLD